MIKLSLLIAFALIVLATSSILKEANETHWAVLVAGSNGFYNYRHQSDVCHAYNILIKNGMPASRIITLAFDDIARSKENIFPGKIFNKPDPTGKGFDVYANCKLDYTGRDVTPTVFLNVLKGDAAKNKGKGNGRVLKSTANDKVFVYFSDHGATGLIAFPSAMLYADDLIKALMYMHTNKLYKRLVFYLEACESGSMFENILPSDIEVYATTAANADESSWASYCPPEDKVNGISINACLGDEYSVNWMEDTEAADGTKKNLQNQFLDIQTKTEGSHVQQYGAITWAKDEVLNNYQGDVAGLIDRVFNKIQQCANKLYFFFHKEQISQLVNSIDTERELNNEINFRKNVEGFFSNFDENFKISNFEVKSVKNFDCLKRSVETFKQSCNALWGEYSLKFVKHLYLACEKSTTDEILEYLIASC